MISSTVNPHTALKLLSSVLPLFLAVPVQAAIVVDTTNEFDPTATSCTLREAIDTANAGTDLLNGCGQSSDEIQLGPYAEYRLTESLPQITADMTLRGSRSQLVRDKSASNFRFFEVLSGELTLELLDLKGGRATDKGGAVRVHPDAALTLSETKFSRNEASSGGAIYSAGQLIIVDSEFRKNHACQQGGAVVAKGGTLIVVGSSFLSDEASWDTSCGSPPVTTEGGALFLHDLTAFEIIGSIFHGLADRGGAIYSASAPANPALISNCTFIADMFKVPGDGNALAVGDGTVTLRRNVVVGTRDPEMKVSVPEEWECPESATEACEEELDDPEVPEDG